MFNKPEYIVIHHSATDDDYKSNWEAIKKYHIEHNKWKNIGYHFGVEEIYGKLFVRYGRPVWEIGAHALGFNENSIGICIVGNYDTNIISLAKKSFVANLIHAVQIVYRIPTANVIGHRETYTLRGMPVEKTCPGANVDMDELRNYVESRQYKEV